MTAYLQYKVRVAVSQVGQNNLVQVTDSRQCTVCNRRKSHYTVQYFGVLGWAGLHIVNAANDEAAAEHIFESCNPASRDSCFILCCMTFCCLSSTVPSSIPPMECGQAVAKATRSEVTIQTYQKVQRYMNPVNLFAELRGKKNHRNFLASITLPRCSANHSKTLAMNFLFHIDYRYSSWIFNAGDNCPTED